VESVSLSDRILATVAQGTDRFALHFMEKLWLSAGGPNTDSDRAAQEEFVEVYGAGIERGEPLAFFPQPPIPHVEVQNIGRLRGGRREHLSWHSGYRTWDPQYQNEYDGYERNTQACAEAMLHEGYGHDTVICLHTWTTGYFALQRQVYMADKLYRAGLNVVLPMLPFHGSRNPAGSRFGGQFFPGTVPQRTNEAFGQSVWDVRSLVRWLRAEGCGKVGVMGMSLGGYVAGLLASVDAELDFAIPMIPMVSMADLLWEHGAEHPIRKEAEGRGITLDLTRSLYRVHSPLELAPRLPAERLMLVAGTGDRICSPEHVERLWEHWGRPRIHWFPGGHILHFRRRRLFDEVLRFIAELPEGPAN